MSQMLDDWGYDPSDRSDEAMAWMGMPVPVEQMPGLLTDEQIDQMRRTPGAPSRTPVPGADGGAPPGRAAHGETRRQRRGCGRPGARRRASPGARPARSTSTAPWPSAAARHRHRAGRRPAADIAAAGETGGDWPSASAVTGLRSLAAVPVIRGRAPSVSGVVVDAGDDVPPAWATRPVVTSTSAPWPTPAAVVTGCTRRGPAGGRWWCGWPSTPPGSGTRSTRRGRAVAARPRLRAVARPPPLPGVGQHLRRPRRASRCGGGAARRSAWAPLRPRATTRATARSLAPPPTCVPAPTARAGVGRRRAAAGRTVRRPRAVGGVERSCTAESVDRGPTHAGPAAATGAGSPTAELAARPAGGGRPTAPARPASSPPPGRARPGCSPSGCATWSSTGATSRAACWRWPTTARPATRWTSAPPGSAPASSPSTPSATSSWPPGSAAGPTSRRSARSAESSNRWSPRRPAASTPTRWRPTSTPWAPSASGCATRSRSRTRGATCPAWPTPSRPTAPSCAAAGVVDFDEQVCWPSSCCSPTAAFRRAQQARYRHLLVDEFQDLTPAHVLLVRLLAAPALRRVRRGRRRPGHLRPRRRRPRFLIDFGRSSPAPPTTPSRSTTAARRRSSTPPATCSSYNRRRVAKEIRAGREADAGAEAALDASGCGTTPAGGRDRAGRRSCVAGSTSRASAPRRRRADPGRLAAAGPARGAGRGRRAGRLDPAARRAAPHRPAGRARLPAHRRRPRPHRPATTWSRSYRRPSRGLPHWIEQVARAAAARSTTWRVAAGRHRRRQGGGQGRRPGRRPATRWPPRPRTGTTREVLEYVRDGVGLGEAIELLDASGGGDGRVAPRRPRGPAPGGRPPPRPRRVRALAARACSTGPATTGGVTLSTVHRVKGREWPRVVVFGATDGLVPHRLGPGDGRGGAPGPPRRHHPGDRPGGGAGRRHPPVAVPGRARPRRHAGRAEGRADARARAARPTAAPGGRARAPGRPLRSRSNAPRGGAARVAARTEPGRRCAGIRRDPRPPPGGHRRAPAHGSGGVGRVSRHRAGEAGGLRRRAGVAGTGPGRRAERARPERQLQRQLIEVVQAAVPDDTLEQALEGALD